MKVYVWTLPTRIFHALLVIFIVAAYISSEWDDFLSTHVALGSAIGVLVLYRVVWGFMGPRYSKFSDLTLNFKDLKEYMFSIFTHKTKYVGHNPAASFALVGILIVVLLLVISGLLTYGIQENRGLLAFLHNPYFKEMELFEEIHEFLGSLLWLLIGAHVAGVLLDRFLHSKDETLKSIATGYKNIEAKSVKLTLIQKLISAIGIGVSIYVLIYALADDNNVITKSFHTSIDFKKENALFVSECSSCHALYPPSLLPKKSWTLLMSDLKNHFGDDASLEVEERTDILRYLIDNSAENSTKEASVKILNSLQNKDTIAITQTPFWKKRHQDIDSAHFKSTNVKSKANCKACHSDVEKGLLEDTNIKIPAIRS